MFELEGIDHVALLVRNVERSADWYCDVFGFKRRHEGMWNGIPVFVGKDGMAVALFPLREDESETARPPNSVRILHLAFRTDRSNFLAAQRELSARHIAFHFEDHEISHSIYFRDPDGHELEVTTYELDEGAAQREGAML